MSDRCVDFIISILGIVSEAISGGLLGFFFLLFVRFAIIVKPSLCRQDSLKRILLQVDIWKRTSHVGAGRSGRSWQLRPHSFVIIYQCRPKLVIVVRFQLNLFAGISSTWYRSIHILECFEGL